jgi:hypothetical protein
LFGDITARRLAKPEQRAVAGGNRTTPSDIRPDTVVFYVSPIVKSVTRQNEGNFLSILNPASPFGWLGSLGWRMHAAPFSQIARSQR